MLFIIVLTSVICVDHKNVYVVLSSVLLSAIYTEYLLYFVCFYVTLILILTYAPLAVGCSALPE
jgi:hypothetical protein